MDTQLAKETLSKEAEEKLREQIATESSEKALKVGIGTAVFCFFVFFVIGSFSKNFTTFVGGIFATTVLSFLAACFFSAIYSNKKLMKHGLSIENIDTSSDEPFKYVCSMESMPTKFNPATGLPMAGGFDTGGNPYGCRRN